MSLMTLIVLVFRILLGLFFGTIAISNFRVANGPQTIGKAYSHATYMGLAFFGLMLLAWFL